MRKIQNPDEIKEDKKMERYSNFIDIYKLILKFI